MAHMQYLVFNNENIPMPASYSVNLSDVEADSGGVTEAGTTQRDVVREGVVQIGVTFHVSKKWLNKFSASPCRLASPRYPPLSVPAPPCRQTRTDS